ncbi:MAG: serine/threonine-protein kinase, partial [Acidobacteriota bacterium]
MRQIGKYQILERIGTGGFAVVYRGYDPDIKRHVAIKLCHSRDEEIRQRFHREAEIAGSLIHPNIALIYDFGVYEQMPYLVEEFLSGEDLAHLIQRQEPAAIGTRVASLLQILRGLRHAHAHGVIHRDIKPANVRVLESGELKLMDFGTAKLADVESQLTQTGVTLGTVAYLAPERLRGKPARRNSDLFSIGVLAFELLS